SKCKIGSNSKLRLLPCSASAPAILPKRLPGSSRNKQANRHTLFPGGSHKGSCLAPATRHSFTALQTERRPGSPHCQTPEGTHRATHKRERTAPTVSLTNTTKTPQLSS